MARHLQLKEPVTERPYAQWGTIAAELAGCQVRFVDGKRWRHRVIEAGSDGPPLLMYHGIGGHAETFARNLRALSEHFHVYAVDARFHGFSSKADLDVPRMYDQLADGVIDLIDALGYRSVCYEGESMGAQLGVNLALHHPERFDRMVLNAGFYLNSPDREGFATATRGASNLGQLSALAVTEPTTENLGNRLRWLVSRPDRMTDDMVSVRRRIYSDPEVNRSLRGIFNLDGGGTFGPHLYDLSYTHDDLKSWRPETLVVWGEHNPGHGPDYGEYWADVIGADFYPFADAGHWPQWEKPDEFNAVLTRFLTR